MPFTQVIKTVRFEKLYYDKDFFQKLTRICYHINDN